MLIKNGVCIKNGVFINSGVACQYVCQLRVVWPVSMRVNYERCVY